MKLHSRRTYLVSLAIGVIVLSFGLLGFGLYAARGKVFKPKPIASPGQAASAALKYTNVTIESLGSIPAVVLSRPIAASELGSLGFPALHPNYSLMLVVVKGDFDITGAWPGSGRGETRFSHINYVFNNASGTPILTIADDGSLLEMALDPSKRITTVPGPGSVPLLPPATDPAAIAPTVTLPGPR